MRGYRGSDGAQGDHVAHVVSRYVALFGAILIVIVTLGAYGDVGLIRRLRAVELTSFERGHATVVPGSVGYFVLYQSIWAGFAATFLAAGAETAGAAWHTHWPLGLLFICLGSACASAPALASVGTLRRGRIVLTADDIVHEGWSSRTRLPWADVAGVMAAFEQQPLIVITGSNGEQWNHEVTTPHVPLGRARRPIWMLDRPARSGSICVECPRLAVDEHRVLRFLSFYADNPAFRSELGTQLSLDRWRALR
ncbi:hypothetical protein [Nocardia cyriacigeorgica]|uniref:hypothetical protein n=1 Tax=Nocardia cyriacigeorgica TaxID=135487 RepID=UPI001892FF85|nr:hypothetical protein [Nocardia cyriacigeorgica]MBF6456930.1 hypothetical protein [Nocardia cyriacigeorgica]MBF6478367.1 hypothetical protein [Nocardia cyriacigeorgica]MBF6551735.1 hypothetical protein [Nocardia cyriacigeorgica]